MKFVDLNGNWRVRAASKRKWVPAVVPGCIHTDLMAAGKIPDPFLHDHEKEVQWVGQQNWIYEREFNTPKFSDQATVFLRCEGLDTLATVSVNGQEVGRADNMHRVWRFDIRPYLREDVNTLSIRFDTPLAYMEARQAERVLPENGCAATPEGRGWVRKMGCNFGTDWVPPLITCGIWRSIGIEVCEIAKITSLAIQQIHGEEGQVALDVDATIEHLPAALETTFSLTVRLNYKGKVVSEGRTLLEKDGQAHLHIPVRNAQLWWPNGLGDQPLYELVAELTGESRKPIDVWTRRIGLRTIRLERKPDDQGGECFQFVVNGHPFFAKGANWVPPDAFITRPTRVEYARLAKAVSVANMNMLRVWGGGIYEQEWFYDLCDEYGICVWQDFMFACTAYPVFDKAWLENVRIEAVQNIERIRHHPCLALWCGNSDIEQKCVGESWSKNKMSGSDYAKLFYKLLPSLVSELDPEHDYWPGSPHNPQPDASVDDATTCSGDVHLWDVWGEGKPIASYQARLSRFCSEFGLQSYPDPRFIRSFTGEKDVDPSSEILSNHQQCIDGAKRIELYSAASFLVPQDPEKKIWLSQIQQGFALRMAVEHCRRNRPYCMGTLYWQLNDAWPAVSWSSLDYAGNWKAAHYFARKFYASILVTAITEPETGCLTVYGHNDLRQAFKGTLQWKVGDTEGRIVRETGCELTIPPNSVRRLGVIKMTDLLEKITPEQLVVWLSLVAEDGYVLSSTAAIFVPPKVLKIADPNIKVDVRPWDDHCYAVTLSAEKPAFWSWIEVRGCHARLDDNFVHLAPNTPYRIRVTPMTNMRIEAFCKALCVRSVWDILNA